MSRFLISVRDLTKTYTVGDVAVRALRGVSLDVVPGESISLTGHAQSSGGEVIDTDAAHLTRIAAVLTSEARGARLAHGNPVARVRAESEGPGSASR